MITRDQLALLFAVWLYPLIWAFALAGIGIINRRVAFVAFITAACVAGVRVFRTFQALAVTKDFFGPDWTAHMLLGSLLIIALPAGVFLWQKGRTPGVPQ